MKKYKWDKKKNAKMLDLYTTELIIIFSVNSQNQSV